MTTLQKKAYFPSFNSIFDDFFATTTSNKMAQQQPMTNIKETEDAFLIEILAPGRKKEDFHVELKDQMLSIETIAKEEKTEEKEEDSSRWLRREFSLSQWKRNFSLRKDSINTDAIEAKYEEGILQLSLPKATPKPQEAKKLIAIS